MRKEYLHRDDHTLINKLSELTVVMLAAATISLFLTNRLQRIVVTKVTTHTPRSGQRRRNTLQGSSKGSLEHKHAHVERVNLFLQKIILEERLWLSSK